MISAIFSRSGGPLAAALITSAASRKYCGPIAAGVIKQSALTSSAAVVVEPVNGPARNTGACPGPTSICFPLTVQVSTPSTP